MAGTFFNYEPGSIQVSFSHDEKFDYINLDVELIQDVTITTACDDQFRPDLPERHQGDPLKFSVYFSSVFCPFGDFIRFLEAITIEVQECGFDWDPEGPYGKMQWTRRFLNDTGFLTITWESHSEKFSHRVMLNTRQAVRALYGAFRHFVESAEYDPLRYEEISNGEAFKLVLADATLDDLEAGLLPLDSETVHSVITRLREVTGARHIEGPKASHSLSYYFEANWADRPLTEWDKLIPDNWDSLSPDQRTAALREAFGWGNGSWDGANLRELRSVLIEEWLAKPEPPPRHSYKIPVKVDNPIPDDNN